MAARPLAAFGALVALNLALIPCFVGVGLLLGDQALLLRELAPGTWLSFAQLLLVAAIARAIHRRDAEGRRWHRTFWGLAAAVFVVFAFDEITQAGIFLSHLLEDAFGLAPAAGFNDLQAVLLTLLFAAAALILLPTSPVLLHHRLALALLAVAVVLGAGSQGLDSFAPATRWEFVAEESLKLCAETFFVGGFLVALRDVLRDGAARRPRAAGAPAVPRSA